jgi:hypothetical protein
VPTTESVPTGAFDALQLPEPEDKVAVQVAAPAAVKFTVPVGVVPPETVAE